ncbi:Fibronectin type III domain-containing protein 5 [Dufourea novaeangliae]|uniref:Fibronectin type III domain-containing protein 5 n=1 Tax=Dufourea novaeangliae TaxID=178035 RepID=A0A154PA57_DUFNO|nr:Fibronectin type III domain-containing protein 5 [Dufourea novaeangliae]
MSPNLEIDACTDYHQVVHESRKRTSLRENKRGNEQVCGTIRGPSLARHFGGMVLWATILFLQGAGFVGSVTGIPGVPENITVMFLNPTSVRVSWSTSQVEQVEKYDVTYKPSDARKHNDSYRVVAEVAGNSEAVTLSGLRADTQYQLAVTAVRAGKKYKSRSIIFRTLEPPRTSPQQDAAVTGGPLPPPPPSSQQPQPYIQVRGVEVGIVVLVLIFWAGAIALFFNRWGKIRMLLPYQPDYKAPVKVPRTGTKQDSIQEPCPQYFPRVFDALQLIKRSLPKINLEGKYSHGSYAPDKRSSQGQNGTILPRGNSANDLAGFQPQDFLRRYGSTSKLCRKVRSADNLPLESVNRPPDQRNSKKESIDGDKESFLKPTPEEKCDDSKLNRQATFKGSPKEGHQQQCSRDFPIATSSSFVGRHFGGWRASGSHGYVPVQPASMDERYYGPSCVNDARPTCPHHWRSYDYAKNTLESSFDVQHFGLPILSVSEPSPPDENDRVDEYL